MTGDDVPDVGGTTVRLRSAWLMTSATNMTLGIAAFVMSPLAARIFGPVVRGRLVAIQLVPQLLADLASLGLGFSIIHFGARRPASVRTLVRWSLRPILIGSVVMFGLGQLIAGPVTGGIAADERMMRTYLLLCPITAFMIVALESLRATGDFAWWNGFVLLRGLSWPIALLAGILPAEPSLSTVVWTHLAISTALTVVLWMILLRRIRGATLAPTVEPPAYVKYGLQSAASTIPRSANARLDQVVMSFRVDRDSLGLYAAAVGWSGLTIPVMRGLTSISMPHISGARADQRVARTRQLVTVGLVAISVLAVGGVLATLVLWRPLYGSEYRTALAAAVILIPAALLLEFNAVLGNVLRSLDRPGFVAVLESGVLVASTVALLAALEFDPVLGPAIVSLGTYLLACLLYAWVIARRLDVGVHTLVDRSLIGRRLIGRYRP